MAGVPNPHSGGAGIILPAPLVPQTFLTAGTFTVTPPNGARFVKLTAKGGDGAGGGQTANEGATAGGSGAIQRRFAYCPRTSFSITVGAGGLGIAVANGNPGTATTALGFTALPGAGGKRVTSSGLGAGGAGTDGAFTLAGDGNFSGVAGAGGNKGNTSPGDTTGGPGLPGYVYLEFYK